MCWETIKSVLPSKRLVLTLIGIVIILAVAIPMVNAQKDVGGIVDSGSLTVVHGTQYNNIINIGIVSTIALIAIIGFLVLVSKHSHNQNSLVLNKQGEVKRNE